MCANAFSRVRRAANGRCPIPTGTGSTSLPIDSRSFFRHVDVNAFDVGQVEAPERAFLEQLEARFAFRAVTERTRAHVRVLADQEFHVLLHLVDRLHLEADVIEPRARGVLSVIVRDLPGKDHQRHAPVGEIEIAVLGPVERRQSEHVRVELGAALGVARTQRDMRDRARLNPIVLGVDVLLRARTPLRQIEDVGVGIVRAVGGEGADGRALYRAQRRIEFRYRRNGGLDIVDFDAEMIEPTGAPVAARNHVHADIAVAQHDRARGPGLARRLHAEEGFVEPPVQRILVGRDGGVVDARGHGPPRRNDQAVATAGAAIPGISKPRASSSAINDLLCAGVSSTSGGLTVAQSGSRPKCAMTAFSAAIMGYFCMTLPVSVMSFWSASALGPRQPSKSLLIAPGLMLPVAVMQPTPPERMLSSRKTSLPANTSKPDFAKASSIALVLFQSPEESFTPATVSGNFFSSRSIKGSVIGTCDTGGICER